MSTHESLQKNNTREESTCPETLQQNTSGQKISARETLGTRPRAPPDPGGLLVTPPSPSRRGRMDVGKDLILRITGLQV